MVLVGEWCWLVSWWSVDGFGWSGLVGWLVVNKCLGLVDGAGWLVVDE